MPVCLSITLLFGLSLCRVVALSVFLSLILCFFLLIFFISVFFLISIPMSLSHFLHIFLSPCIPSPFTHSRLVSLPLSYYVYFPLIQYLSILLLPCHSFCPSLSLCPSGLVYIRPDCKAPVSHHALLTDVSTQTELASSSLASHPLDTNVFCCSCQHFVHEPFPAFFHSLFIIM